MGPVFSDEFRRELQTGKYTRWATNLTMDQLRGILWLVGELACRGEWMLEVLAAQRAQVEPLFGAYSRRRPLIALRLLIRSIVYGRVVSFEEASSIAREAAVAEAQESRGG